MFCQAALAVTRQELTLEIRLIDRRIALVDHPQRLGLRLIKVAVRIIDTHQVF